MSLAIQTTTSSEAWKTKPHGKVPLNPAPVLLALLLLPLLLNQFSRKRLRLAARPLAVMLVALLSLGAVLAICGCGSGGVPSRSVWNSAGSTTYSLVVTTTSGKLQHTCNLTLVVEN